MAVPGSSARGGLERDLHGFRGVTGTRREQGADQREEE
jgi:hypothetical protein